MGVTSIRRTRCDHGPRPGLRCPATSQQSRRWESNPRPDDYKSSALPTAPHRPVPGSARCRSHPTIVSPVHRGLLRRRPPHVRAGPDAETLASASRRLAGWRAVANPSEHDSRPSGGPGGRQRGIPVRPRAHRPGRLRGRHRARPQQAPSRRRPRRPRGRPRVRRSTTTTKPAHPTTTTTTIAPSKVPVLVANASGVTGAAAAISAQLKPAGWDTAAPGRRLGPGDDVARVLRGRLQTRGRYHRLLAAAAGHLGGPVYDRGPDQLDRNRGGGGGGGPRPGRQDRHRDHLVHRHLIGEPGDRAGPRWCSHFRHRRSAGPSRRCLADPSRSAVVSDFDGTLSPIVADPAEARPLGGVAELLGPPGPPVRRGGRGVGSARFLPGRPTGPGRSWTIRRRCRPGRIPVDLRLVGLYGLEWSDRAGAIIREPGAERWRPVVDEVAGAAAFGAPLRESWSRARVWPSPSTGAGPRRPKPGDPGRRRPSRGGPGSGPIPGGCRSSCARPSTSTRASVVRRLVEGCSAACYLGDDLGDLPAFAALAELTATHGMATVSVAVVDDESAPEVAEAADLTRVRSARGAGTSWAGSPTPVTGLRAGGHRAASELVVEPVGRATAQDQLRGARRTGTPVVPRPCRAPRPAPPRCPTRRTG